MSIRFNSTVGSMTIISGAQFEEATNRSAPRQDTSPVVSVPGGTSSLTIFTTSGANPSFNDYKGSYEEASNIESKMDALEQELQRERSARLAAQAVLREAIRTRMLVQKELEDIRAMIDRYREAPAPTTTSSEETSSPPK